ncbi:unnamed protein product [Soboliphyme baturini]|uniref:Aa_trans domain-containing protein n=1 Tax=Soboliphyme baturini TaxID=241478 RepID=A0A183IBR0_9BILA|nr:unnamed protein product [Soboliphyme baturini]
MDKIGLRNSDVGMISLSTRWLLSLNLVNGVMGVSALVLPSCFHQCGILLGCVLLLITNFFTKLSCSFLMLAAGLTHRDTYDGLGMKAYGQVGKGCVEVVTALYVFGNLIAFFVVVADITPSLLKVFIDTDLVLGPLSVTAVAAFAMLPLSLSRSVRTVCKFSLAAMVCYLMLVLRLLVLCKNCLLVEQTFEEVNY